MATKESSNNSLYLVFKSLYLKNDLGDPIFIAEKWSAV